MVNHRGLQSQWRCDVKRVTHDQGFALLEVIIAVAIMALVGLMAWRGMDAMIRGREVIDRRANQDANYSQLVRQFERDCQEVLRRPELSSLALAMGNSVTQGSNISALAAGAKNLWFMRRFRADNQDAWLIAGYVMGPNGLQRWTSRPLLRRVDAAGLWTGILRDPDLSSSDLLLSLEVPAVTRQSFLVQTSIFSGAGGSGTSAGGTGSPSAASNPTNTSGATTNPIALSPEQLGVTMQWWVKDSNLPITRSCLMGAAL